MVDNVRCQDTAEWNCADPDNPINLCPGEGSQKPLRNLVESWSGGDYDSTRQKLIIFGGGHADYCGNELWEFDVNTLTWAQATRPTADMGSDGNPANREYSDGRPKSPHSYEHPVFVPTTGEFCSMLRACFPAGGEAYYGFYCNDPTNRGNIEVNTGPMGWTQHVEGLAGRDAISTYYNDKVYLDGGSASADNHLYEWNPVTDAWAQIGSGEGLCGDKQIGDIDPNNEELHVYVGPEHGRIYQRFSGAIGLHERQRGARRSRL
jgi:hypothetical protein